MGIAHVVQQAGLGESHDLHSLSIVHPLEDNACPTHVVSPLRAAKQLDDASQDKGICDEMLSVVDVKSELDTCLHVAHIVSPSRWNVDHLPSKLTKQNSSAGEMCYDGWPQLWDVWWGVNTL